MTFNRVSTASIFDQGTFQLLRQQSAIARTQLEVSSGRKIITAQDDPIGAGLSQAIDRSLDEIKRWGDNSNILQSRLANEEQILKSVGERFIRLRELAVQANSAIQTPETLRGMLEEVNLIKADLGQLANATDGTGRFLFGGTLDGSPPFIANLAGGFDYVGDQGQRRLEIGPELTVADTDPGSEIFQRVRTGNGEFAIRPAFTNTGTGTLQTTGFVDPALYDGRAYTVTFGVPVSGDYTVTDTLTAAVITTGTFISGQPIVFQGVQLTLIGTPADGDVFNADPAPNRDLFETAQNLADAINLANVTPAQKAARQNAFYAAIEDLAEAADYVFDSRANLGARLATIDRTADQRQADDEILRGTLSEIRDTDYAEAISRLSFQLQSLEAAQQSFLRIQDLSLFNLLR